VRPFLEYVFGFFLSFGLGLLGKEGGEGEALVVGVFNEVGDCSLLRAKGQHAKAVLTRTPYWKPKSVC
jgi:hypothetical protein